MNSPHGDCQCKGCCGCASTPGPAAYEIARDGIRGRIRVCTRCVGATDKILLVLVKKGEPADTFAHYDPSGAKLLARRLQMLESAHDPSSKPS